MLRLMAQYADAVSMGFGRGLDDLRTKLGVLREHCQALNRPYEYIEKTTLFFASSLGQFDYPEDAIDPPDNYFFPSEKATLIGPPS